MMLFRQLFDNVSCTYTYFIADKVSRKTAIIDPVKTHVEQYLRLLKELELQLVMVLDTHLHADHITGSGLLQDDTACEIIMGDCSKAQGLTRCVKDGEILKIG